MIGRDTMATMSISIATIFPRLMTGCAPLEEGVALLLGLSELGYETVVATPHMRTSMFPNDRPTLQRAFADFEEATATVAGLPILGLGSEHFFDDVFWARFLEREVLPYPGGHALLVELPPRQLPVGLARSFFEMRVRGISPVLAHPERYEPLYRTTAPIETLLQGGALPLLDLMSLVGKYGRRPRKAAQRMLDEGVYVAACSDCHRPQDVALVASAIAELHGRVGPEDARALLADGPRRILEGTVADA